jgi:hypothetical protein
LWTFLQMPQINRGTHSKINLGSKANCRNSTLRDFKARSANSLSVESNSNTSAFRDSASDDKPRVKKLGHKSGSLNLKNAPIN